MFGEKKSSLFATEPDVESSLIDKEAVTHTIIIIILCRLT